MSLNLKMLCIFHTPRAWACMTEIKRWKCTHAMHNYSQPIIDRPLSSVRALFELVMLYARGPACQTPTDHTLPPSLSLYTKYNYLTVYSLLRLSNLACRSSSASPPSATASFAGCWAFCARTPPVPGMAVSSSVSTRPSSSRT